MTKFRLIDFGTIELPSNFKIKVRGTSDDYKSIKFILSIVVIYLLWFKYMYFVFQNQISHVNHC